MILWNEGGSTSVFYIKNTNFFTGWRPLHWSDLVSGSYCSLLGPRKVEFKGGLNCSQLQHAGAADMEAEAASQGSLTLPCTPCFPPCTTGFTLHHQACPELDLSWAAPSPPCTGSPTVFICTRHLLQLHPGLLCTIDLMDAPCAKMPVFL